MSRKSKGWPDPMPDNGRFYYWIETVNDLDDRYPQTLVWGNLTKRETQVLKRLMKKLHIDHGYLNSNGFRQQEISL